jgi:putative transposase
MLLCEKTAEAIQMRRAKQIALSKRQRRILEDLSEGTHTELHLIYRSRIVLMAAEGAANDAIEEALGLSNRAVIKWRGRFHAAAAVLADVEEKSPLKLKKTIISTLSDARRSGAKPRNTDSQVAEIIALSLDNPQSAGLPLTHWTSAAIRDAAIKKGIVDTISISQARRYLKKKILSRTNSRNGSIRA